MARERSVSLVEDNPDPRRAADIEPTYQNCPNVTRLKLRLLSSAFFLDQLQVAGFQSPKTWIWIIESIKLTKSLTTFFIEPDRGAWDDHPLDYHGRFHAMVPQSLW